MTRPTDTTTLAEAAMEMVRAHQPHPKATRANQSVSCSGISDPLTGHFCQFTGTTREQLTHATERVAAALAAAGAARKATAR